MMNNSIISLVRDEGRWLSLSDLLTSPVTILQGVSNDAATVLEAIDISTAFDLSASSVFATARRIADATRPNSELGAIGRVPANMVDKDSRSVPLKDLYAEGIEVLKSIGPQTAVNLGTALAVNTIRDLALWPNNSDRTEVQNV
jgi:hypothetical protein